MIKTTTELIAFAYQVLDDEFNIQAENYTTRELKEISHLFELILSQRKEK